MQGLLLRSRLGAFVVAALVAVVAVWCFGVASARAAAAGWWSAGNMSAERGVATATLLNDGDVLVAGGDSDGGAVASADLFDPVSNTWSAAGSMSTGRWEDTATLLGNGNVLVAGGIDPNISWLKSAELYDPASDTWSPARDMTTARYGHVAALLKDGKVLVAGGWGYSGAVASAELYDPTSNSWSSAGSMSTGRYLATATALPNGKVLVVGGISTIEPNSAQAGAELYDPASNSWSAAASMVTARFGATATLLSSGKVLVAGGDDSNGDALRSAELYDPTSNAWTSATSMNNPHAYQTATLLSTGNVLIVGGDNGNNPYTPETSAELYDPTSDTWSSAGSMSDSRERATATALNDGRVLVAGGDQGGPNLASAELYELATTASVVANGAGDFGSETVGQSSAIQSLQVTNTGGEPLYVTGISVTGPNGGDFSVASDTCNDVASGQTCSLGVNFTPTAAGTRSATLTFNDNGQTGTQGVTLTGNGIAANSPPAGPTSPTRPTSTSSTPAPPVVPRRVTLKTCNAVSKIVKHKKTSVQKCTGRRISGPAGLTATGHTARATLTRGRHVYATGVLQANGRLVLHPRGRLPSGRYTLSLTTGNTTKRYTITIH